MQRLQPFRSDYRDQSPPADGKHSRPGDSRLSSQLDGACCLLLGALLRPLLQIEALIVSLASWERPSATMHSSRAVLGSEFCNSFTSVRRGGSQSGARRVAVFSSATALMRSCLFW